MESIDEYAASPPRPLVGVSLVQQGLNVIWPEPGLGSSGTPQTECDALSLLRAASKCTAGLSPAMRFRTMEKGYRLPQKKRPNLKRAGSQPVPAGAGSSAAAADGDDDGDEDKLDSPSSSHRQFSEPVGVFKQNWFRKYTMDIPSVLLLPVHFDPHPDQAAWQKMENEIMQCTSEARSSLAGRSIRVVLICICQRDYPIEQESKERLQMAQDRLRNLRLRASLEKSECHLVYSADLNGQSANLSKIVKSIHNISMDYYKAACKYVRDHKRHFSHSPELSLPGTLVLQARHNLKIGYFYEFRGQMSKSTKHIEASFNKLVELARLIDEGASASRSSRITLEEIKSVASLVSYTLCRQQIWQKRSDLAEAQLNSLICKFRKMRSRPPVDERAGARRSNEILYKSRMWKWIGVQSEIFADLLMHAKASHIPLTGDRSSNRMRKSKAGSGVEPGQGLLMCTHLYNAMQAYRRNIAFVASLRKLCALEGGVALDTNESDELSMSAYIGGLPCFSGVTPSVVTVTGDMRGFIAVHKHLCKEELEFDASEYIVTLAHRTVKALEEERGLKAGDSVSPSSPNLLPKQNNMRRSRHANIASLCAAHELVCKKQYREAATLLNPCIYILRRDRWPILLANALRLARKCAIDGNIGSDSMSGTGSKAGLEMEPSYGLHNTLQLLSIVSDVVPKQERELLHDSIFSAAATGGKHVKFDMGCLSSPLIHACVLFKEAIVQVRDSVNVSLQIKSSLPKPMKVNCIRLVLQHIDQSMATSVDAGNPENHHVASNNLTFVCLLVANEIEDGDQPQSEKPYGISRGGSYGDNIITLPLPENAEGGETLLKGEGTTTFNLSLSMDVGETVKMPKQGLVIFPTEMSVWTVCDDLLGTQCSLELFSDLAYERSMRTANLLHAIDPFKSSGVLSLLRTKSNKEGRVLHAQESAQSVRLIPPVSVLNISSLQHEKLLFNDWHPITIIIKLDSDLVDEHNRLDSCCNISEATDLKLSMWVSDLTGRTLDSSDKVDLAFRKDTSKNYQSYDPQSPGK